MYKTLDVLDKCSLIDFCPIMGQGVYLFEENNRKVIDLSTNLPFGYGNSIIDNAIIRALHSGILVSSDNINLKLKHEVSEKLCLLADFFEVENTQKKVNGKVAFCNSSEDAIETAIKVARKRYNTLCDRDYNEIICFTGCFHGNSILAMSCNKNKKQKLGFEPLMDCFKTAKFNDIKSVEELITEHTSAVLIEPIQIYYGIQKCEKKFLKELRDLCDKHEILLIFDETKCGGYKTNDFFAYQSFGIKPDIVCLGNNLAGGLNFGVSIMNNKSCAFYNKTNMYDYTNNIALNVANLFLNLINDDNFLEQLTLKSAIIKEQMSYLFKYNQNIIDDVSCTDFLCTIKFNSDIDCNQVYKILFANNLLVQVIDNNSVLLNFPFIITKEQVEDVVEIIETTIKEIAIIERY